MKLTLTYSGGLLEIIKPIRPLQNELSLNFAEILNTIVSWFLFGYYQVYFDLSISSSFFVFIISILVLFDRSIFFQFLTEGQGHPSVHLGNYQWGRHSSVDSSVPTILPPQVRVPSTPSSILSLQSICVIFVMRKERK